MSRTFLAAFALVLAVSVPASPAKGEPVPGDPAAPIYLRLEKTASGVNTVTSGFVQEKHLSMFKAVVVSKGRLHYWKPDRLRWEYTEPVASGFVLNGNKGRRWHQRTGRTESFDLRTEPVMKLVADQLFAWAKPDFEGLRKEYRIRVLSENPVSLRLEPISAAMAESLDHIRISFSPDARFLRSVEIHEKDGDSTRIRFVDTVVNRPMAPELFR